MRIKKRNDMRLTKLTATSHPTFSAILLLHLLTIESHFPQEHDAIYYSFFVVRYHVKLSYVSLQMVSNSEESTRKVSVKLESKAHGRERHWRTCYKTANISLA